MFFSKNILEKEVIFVGGKGGVGKTTMSSAIAMQLANQGKKVLIISTDPAHSLGDVFNVKLSNKIKSITKNLDAVELNSQEVLKEHFEKVESTLIKYTKPQMVAGVKKYLEQAKNSPGGEEAALLEATCEYLVNFKTQGYEYLIFDTAPTGHTLRLLTLPQMMITWTKGLLKRANEREKLKEAAENFWDEEDKNNPFAENKQDRFNTALEVLEKRQHLFHKASHILKDNSNIVLVMIPEMLSFEETKRAITFLEKEKMPILRLIINQIIPKQQNEDFWKERVKLQQNILESIHKTFTKKDIVEVELKKEDIRGIENLSKLII